MYYRRQHQELGLLLVLVAVAILTYSSLVYFVEREVSHMEDMDCSQWRNQTTKGKHKYKVEAATLDQILC